MGNMGIWQLLIIAVIVILLFGTKKLRSLGGDLGGAVKGFKNAMSSEEEKKALEETAAEKTAPSVEKTAPNAEKKTESKDKEQV
ncbi:Sec-independent protein translocase protein TatA [Shewanella hanedai]|jgi:sec-independent protein translocase protein TatA|uniref:Sec-independent protein translocase protein TatA n=1 Tax=Shewanella hanedai TaxID=25 RepID=A0A553JUF3_SHEHA|nr:twin-arginine translocase TatA/TatE family subunit [Shewanella hanedai]TRY16077.1 twin-arginine translocase TatA/TatE family subunit [Shewanella hanedai]GGI91584.1 Sec-independent protein translocase protein TatA [Shewanella hanedai]